MIRVTLDFGDGSLSDGCNHIKVDIRHSDGASLGEDRGCLPASPKLWSLYKSWQENFSCRFGGRIAISNHSRRRSSEVEKALSQCSNQFLEEFNQWLNHKDFCPITNLIKDKLEADVPFLFTIKTEDKQLRYLPWYLWQFFEDYPKAEPALAFTKFDAQEIDRSQRNKVRVLVVIGDSEGINTKTDQKSLETALGDAQIEILPQPSHKQLNESLRDKQGWDILAFLGHSTSSSDGDTGYIKINPGKSLALDKLKDALSEAIKKGLQLAIFNSCDGLGLVKDLRGLHLPNVIVMRESVPDKIAQEFIKDFLRAFKERQSLPLAVQEGRKKLAKWEEDYPCATWLPVLCQNPEVKPTYWVHLGGKPDCPYRGLLAFKEEDADVFYGRENDIDNLFDRIIKEKDPLVAVVGASGSGKSSLVFAGLVPRLRKSEKFKIVDFRPGKDPFESLATALTPLWYKAKKLDLDFDKLLPNERDHHQSDLIAMLKGKKGLCGVVETIIDPQSDHLVLIADQFEELYTLLSKSEEKTEEKTCELFLNSLLNAVGISPDFTLILTLRKDFYDHVTENDKFSDLLNKGRYQYILKSMNGKELEQAIGCPAEKYNIKLQEGLLDVLVTDVGNENENLPLLEFALTLLCEEHELGCLTRDAYKKIGGLEQSLARHADGIFNDLTEAERQQMKRVFIQLVRPGKGTTAHTRNILKKSDFNKSCDWDLITKLNEEKNRLLVINSAPNGEPTVEIIHEALINSWGKLESWIRTFRDFRIWQDKLEEKVKKWKDKKEDPGYLLADADLGEAAGWLNKPYDKYQEILSGSQRAFIQASLKKQKQTILRLAGLSIASLFFAGFAGLNWLNSEISETREKLNNLVAISQSRFDSGLYEDALFKAMKASQLSGKTWWNKWIATDLKEKVDVALYRAVYDSIIENHTLQGHQGDVSSVVYNPDGQTLASASDDGTVKIWDAQTGQLRYTLQGHQGRIISVAYSPDGQTLASTSIIDDTVRIWDAQTGQLRHALQGHQGTATSVVYSPDGQTLASASIYDDTVRMWDVQTGQLRHTLQGHHMVYSPDGQTLASSSEDGTVRIWDAQTGQLRRTLQGHQDRVTSVIYSPDGQTLASASDDGIIRIWDAQTGQPRHTLEAENQAGPHSVVYSPDGQTLVSKSALSASVEVWDAQTGQPLYTLEGHQGFVFEVVHSPDGQTLASASGDGTVRIWDAQTGQLLYTLQRHQGRVNRVAYSPDGQTLASASEDETVRIWNVQAEQALQRHQYHIIGGSPDGQTLASVSLNNIAKVLDARTGHLRHVADKGYIVYSPDGQTLASVSDGEAIKVLDAQTGQLLYTLEGHQDAVNSLDYSPDGQTLASASADKTIKVWDAQTGQLRYTLEGHQGRVNRVAYSPDGQTLASASADKTIKVWDAQTGQLRHTFDRLLPPFSYLVYNPDGQTLAMLNMSSALIMPPEVYPLPEVFSPREFEFITVWNVHTGQLLYTLQHAVVTGVDYSPDGQTLASASWDETVKVWDAQTGQLRYTLEGHQGFVLDVIYSPDGQTLASASEDEAIKVWDAQTGQIRHTLEGHQDAVNSVIYSPDGQTLASASEDGTIKVWDAQTGQIFHSFQSHHSGVRDVVYSPDGQTLVSKSGDQTITVWNWNQNRDHLIKQGCNRLESYLVNHPEKLKELEVCQ